MGRRASSALAPLDEALRRLTEGIAPVGARVVSSASAIGLVSACDVRAPTDVPSGPAALRDGWATVAAAVTGASAYSPLLPPRPPVWVEAGAPLPAGADVVLPQDALAGREFVEDAPALDGVVAAGGEIRAGSLLLGAGERVTPLRSAGLAAAGVATLAVRSPRLRVVVTGDPAPLAGDAVSAALRALAAASGASVEFAHEPDDVERIAAAVAADGPDAIFVVGGTGMGRTDRSVEALRRAGELMLHGLALRPGETAAVGRAASRPVLLAPGRPDAAFAVFVAMLRPLLARLSGAAPSPPERTRLTRKIASTIGLTEVVFVRRTDDGAEPLGGAELPIGQLMRSDGAVLVNPEREGYPEGADIEVTPL